MMWTSRTFPGPTRRISARTYLRLRFLDAPSLRAALHDSVTEEEVAALLQRRDAILAFFDGLVAEKGPRRNQQPSTGSKPEAVLAGGAFIYWCSNARQLDTVPMSEWNIESEVLLSDTRILDVLIQNSDRHAGHFLFAEHWA
ncbi:hypothetical protein TSOC_004669, partial [Tetrabaena socialis]